MKGNEKAYLAICATATILLYFLFDPTTNRWFPQCLFKTQTGYSCALCGTQRALHSLLHGDLHAALHHNLLAVMALPLLLLAVVPFKGKALYRHLYNKTGARFVIYTVSILLIGWSILRNLIQL